MGQEIGQAEAVAGLQQVLEHLGPDTATGLLGMKEIGQDCSATYGRRRMKRAQIGETDNHALDLDHDKRVGWVGIVAISKKGLIDGLIGVGGE